MTAKILKLPLMAYRISLDKYPNRIRELREAAGISQEALGQMVGLTKPQISRLELGKRGLELEWMRRIARALGVATADLLNAEDNPLSATEETRRLIENYQMATDEGRHMIAGVAESAATFRHGEKIVPFATR